jgi:hypothetical protein
MSPSPVAINTAFENTQDGYLINQEQSLYPLNNRLI